nr:type 1 glutamine amidotransferase [Syntrophotalea acetylenivorans]
MTLTRLYAGERLPGVEDFDWLLIMGGPMNIYQEKQYPWLKTEKAYIDQALIAGKTLLGICLGAQLLADRLGSQVYAGAEREIGWWPLSLTEAGRQSELFGELDEPLQAYHWHGDTFDLPAGSVSLASSTACAQQAFLYNHRVLGLQFHFEVTPESMERLIEQCGEEILPGSYVQSVEQMLATPQATFDRLHESLYRLLDGLSAVDGSV